MRMRGRADSAYADEAAVNRNLVEENEAAVCTIRMRS